MTSNSETKDGEAGLSRRAFLKGAGGVAAGSVLRAEFEEGARAAGHAEGPPKLAGTTRISLSVNGAAHEVAVEPRTTLLSALRHHLEPAHTGTKEVCDQGNCGACTVLLDGEPVCACLVLAVDAVGSDVRTVEGLEEEGELSALQRELWQEDGLQCGYCTPGFLMSLEGLFQRKQDPDLAELRAALSGNTCRCGTYPHIFKAAGQLAGRKGGK